MPPRAKVSATQFYRDSHTYWSDIQDHLEFLYETAHGNVLELGVRGGTSTGALLAGVEKHGGFVWSVDIDPNCWGVWHHHPLWKFIHCDSADVSAILKHRFDHTKAVPAGDIDVLFIDTSHTYEQTTKELNSWFPHMRRQSVILLHDHDDPGVSRAVAEFTAKRGLKYAVRPNSHELAVIQIP